MNPIEQFKQAAMQQYGANLDPKTMAMNLLGNSNVQTPQQALLQLYQFGRINQQQYQMYLRML